MAKLKTLILKSAGTNCDYETINAVKLSGGIPEEVYIHTLIKNPRLLKEFEFVIIPGGFSYGDDIASGKVLATEINNFIKEEFKQFIENGRLVLGICNGFQVLVKSGLLPNNSGQFVQEVSLIFNDNGVFTDKWIYLKKTNNSSVFLENLPDVFPLPIAHAEGRFIKREYIEIENNIAFQYCNEQGNITEKSNPNGSYLSIAAITDKTGRVLGMMPHPERYLFGYQHPNNVIEGITPGMQIFLNAYKYLNNI